MTSHEQPHSGARAATGAWCAAAAFATLLGLAGPGLAQSSDACSFFDGKTVELVVPFSVGGGYDIYGRMVAKYYGPELGAANMIVLNQPGAGGLLATNQTYQTKPDGLKIQLASIIGIASAELGGAEGARYKSDEFSWLGRITNEPDIVVVAPDSPIHSLQDIQALGAQRTVLIGSTGLGSPQYISIKLLSDFIETDARIVTGYAGVSEVLPSLLRGEVDLFVLSLSGAESAQAAGTARMLWAVGTDPVQEDTGEVPPLSSVISDRFQPLNRVHGAAIAAGRALLAPPAMDPDRLQCMRDAFDRTMASDGLLAESRQINRPVDPLDGAQVEGLVNAAIREAPPEYIEVLRSSYGQ